MQKWIVMLLVSTVVPLPGCGNSGDDDGVGGEGDTDSEEIDIADACVQLMGCAGIVDPDSVPGLEESYGEDSPCWDNQDNYFVCQGLCEDALSVYEMAWDYPWSCEAGAPTNTSEIETLNGITWEWTVVGGDDCISAGVNEWTVYTTFTGAEDWTFTAVKWVEHPTEGVVEHPPMNCRIFPDTYYDFVCDEEYQLAEMEGVFDPGWGSATATWKVYDSTLDIMYLCDLEAERSPDL
jgi:hypothetical protein